MVDTLRGAHSVVRAANETDPIPEVVALVERALAAGLSVMEDRPDRTPYATCGVSIYDPAKRPPPTLVVEFVRAGADAPWAIYAATTYGEKAKTNTYPVSHPDEVEALVASFLENHAP